MFDHQSSVSGQLWFSQAEIRNFFRCHFCLASLDGSWLNFPVKSGSIFGVVGTWHSRNMNIHDSSFFLIILMAFKEHEYSWFIWFTLMDFSISQVHGVPLPGDSTQLHGRISYITATVRHRRWSCAHYILPQSTLTECIAICECLATIVCKLLDTCSNVRYILVSCKLSCSIW